MDALSGKSLIKAIPTVVFPHPDSPTKPKDLPRFRRKETPSTAFIKPLRV
jgi:hypothetical protein